MDQDNAQKKGNPENVASQVLSKFHAKSDGKGERDPSTVDKTGDLSEERDRVEILGRDKSVEFPEPKTEPEPKSEPTFEPTLEHWLISLKNFLGDSTDTIAIKEHPASWLAKYGSKRTIIFVMKITPEQYEDLLEVGYR